MVRVTSRTYVFLGAALVVYFFANQTQVGWLYVMSALLAGTVIAAGWLSRGSLRGLAGERTVGDSVTAELYEGEEITVALTLRSGNRAGLSQIRVVEHCPLNAPDDPHRATNLFIPSLPARRAVEFSYPVTVYKRGLHT